jgi:hypothetical protein
MQCIIFLLLRILIIPFSIYPCKLLADFFLIFFVICIGYVHDDFNVNPTSADEFTIEIGIGLRLPNGLE